MPIETYLASAAVIILFGSFIAALAWVLVYTRDVTPHW